jgi:hypothetical protein
VANNFVHGKLVAVQLTGTYFATLGISWSDGLSDLEDITFTVSGGATFAVYLPGYRKATATLDFVWDTLNIPLAGNINLTPGTLVPLIWTPDGTNLFTANAWSNGFTFPPSGPTKGPVKVSVPLVPTGSYTIPT